MDDWQGFLTRAVLWPCCISLGKESQAASIDLLFWAAEAGCQDLCDEQNVSFQIYSCYLRHILSEYEHLTSSTYLSLVQLQFFYHFLWVHEILSALLNYLAYCVLYSMLNYEIVICQKIHGNLLSVPEETEMRRALTVFI